MRTKRQAKTDGELKTIESHLAEHYENNPKTLAVDLHDLFYTLARTHEQIAAIFLSPNPSDALDVKRSVYRLELLIDGELVPLANEVLDQLKSLEE